MPNVAPILDKQLSPAQSSILKRVAGASLDRGVALYLVGGTVRDALLGYQPLDLDLCAVSADSTFALALAGALDGRVEASSRFGTSKLRVGGADIDLALARRESYEHPGALPSVAPGAIDEDLARRDFSINAMAISLMADTWGDLLDPFDGQGDLRRKLIRVLHPGSFVDDATRILRAVRYAGRLGFQLEGVTERLMMRDMSYLDTIKGDRVRHELERMFHEERAVSILKLSQEAGVLEAIHPALALSDSVIAKLRELTSARTPVTDLVFVSLLTYSASASERVALIRRLNMNSAWARVVQDTGSVKGALDRLNSPGVRPSQVNELLNPFDTSAIGGCALVTDEPLAAHYLKLYLSELRYVKPSLDGDDLIALGAPRGPAIGRLLSAIKASKLDGLLATREDEIGFVIRCLGQSAQ